MSAIDFYMDIKRTPDPKGDCVKVVLSGKFWPYNLLSKALRQPSLRPVPLPKFTQSSHFQVTEWYDFNG